MASPARSWLTSFLPFYEISPFLLLLAIVEARGHPAPRNINLPPQNQPYTDSLIAPVMRNEYFLPVAASCSISEPNCVCRGLSFLASPH